MAKGTCSVETCEIDTLARGYCSRHWQRWKRTGSPTGSTRKTLRERFDEYVDRGPGCWVWGGQIDWTGYGKISVGGRGNSPRQAHRVSYEMNVGLIPEGMVLDHICHNRACVNPQHLRVATNKQNTENPSGIRVDNTSGHQGVSWSERDKAWRAYANHNGKQYSAGYHASALSAADAARKLRLELFTHNELDKAAA